MGWCPRAMALPCGCWDADGEEEGLGLEQQPLGPALRPAPWRCVPGPRGQPIREREGAAWQ